MRHDLHFPSCYDQSKGLTDYKNNMVFPTVTYDANGVQKQNCPEGFLHVPHIFYEMYWNTPLYDHLWTPNSGAQPFVLSNGDLSGCSGHGDFIAAWDTNTLANIIDNCNAGDDGMDKCPGVTVRDKTTSCSATPPPSIKDEPITGNLTALPGNNPLEGWGMSLGGGNSSAAAATAAASPSVVPVEKKEEGTTAPELPVATTFSTSSRCVHTVTVFADPAAETVNANVKREDAHAHAHAHAARHQSPHHR